MSNISYRAKRVRLEGDGLGQPRASGHSDERKRVRAEVGSFLVRLIGGMIAVALLWILVSRFVVPALIASAYRGESLPFLNSIISGRAIHPLELYLTTWEGISWRVLGMMFVVGLIPLPLVATGPEVQSYFESRYGSTLALKPEVTNAILAIFGLALVFYLYYLQPVGYVYFVTEDHWAEYGSFVSWAMAACFITWMLFKSPGLRKPGVALLAFGTFFVAMEEISWGQRILDIPSPTEFTQYNLQGEINLHNLVFNVPRMYVVAGIVIGLWSALLPLLTRRWERLHKWCGKWGIPIVPTHLWPLFLVAVFYLIWQPVAKSGEVSELFLGIAMAALSLDLVLTTRRGAKVEGVPATVAATGMVVTLGILTVFLVQFHSWPGALEHALNEFAVTGFPNVGMHRQSEMVFEYLNQHPKFLTPETRFRQGVLLMQRGESTKAKEILELALTDQKRFQQKWPEHPVPYCVAGQVLTLLGRQQEAQAAFQDAIEKDRARLERVTGAEAEASIRWSLGKTLFASGDSVAASEQLSMARALASARRTQSLIDKWIQENLSRDALEKPPGFAK